MRASGRNFGLMEGGERPGLGRELPGVRRSAEKRAKIGVYLRAAISQYHSFFSGR